jgi:hypothetical protein
LIHYITLLYLPRGTAHILVILCSGCVFNMAPPTLDVLPSELRKLKVSFLAPSGSDGERYARNGKIHLKNANMAARCLHEWVPEFMFRDMSLLHVSVDIASHLERFAITKENASYLKFVKTIQVKVRYVYSARIRI